MAASQLAQLQEQLAAATAAHANDVAWYQHRVAELEAAQAAAAQADEAAAAYEARIASLEAAHAALVKERDDLASELGLYRDRTTALEASEVTTAQTRHALEDALAAAQHRSAELEAELASARLRAAELEAGQSALMGTIQALQDGQASREMRQSELEGMAAEAARHVDESQAAVAAYQARVAALEAELAEGRDTAARQQQEASMIIDDWQAAVSVRDRTVQDVLAEKEAMQVARQLLQSELDQATTARDEAVTAIEHMQRQLEAVVAERDRLVQDAHADVEQTRSLWEVRLADAQAAGAQAVSALATKTREVDALHHDFAALRAQLEQAQQGIDEERRVLESKQDELAFVRTELVAALVRRRPRRGRRFRGRGGRGPAAVPHPACA